MFWLAFLLSGGRASVATLTALLFGVHPMQVESVVWVSERKNVLYTFFFLAAAIAYVRYLDAARARWLVLAFALYLASCLSKATAVVFPMAMMLIDAWKRRPPTRRMWLEKLPFFAASLLFGWLTLDLQGGGDAHGLLQHGPHDSSALGRGSPFSPYQRASLPAYAFLWYLDRFLVPRGLCAFHPYPSTAEASDPRFLFAPLVLLAVLALAVWSFKRDRLLVFGLGWYFVNLALVLQWLPVGRALMAERYAYLPVAGIAFVVALGIPMWLGGRPSPREGRMVRGRVVRGIPIRRNHAAGSSLEE